MGKEETKVRADASPGSSRINSCLTASARRKSRSGASRREKRGCERGLEGTVEHRKAIAARGEEVTETGTREGVAATAVPQGADKQQISQQLGRRVQGGSARLANSDLGGLKLRAPPSDSSEGFGPAHSIVFADLTGLGVLDREGKE